MISCVKLTIDHPIIPGANHKFVDGVEVNSNDSE
jgi:hypothetical protein